MQSDTTIEQHRRRVATQYRRQGYRVTKPGNAAALPSFLRDCHPDLIAEKSDDHVVIEIKSTRALKGSNDLTELAGRVASQPGWRLELVAIGSENEDAVALSDPGWLDRMLQRPCLAGDPTLAGIHVVFLCDVLDVLLRGMAGEKLRQAKDKTSTRIAKELAYRGVIDQDVLDEIADALNWRNLLMHGQPVSRPPADQAGKLIDLCRRLHAQAMSKETMAA